MWKAWPLPYEPKNMIDLNWKIMLLVGDRPGQIRDAESTSSSTSLYEYETPEGGWPYPFDKKAKPADFISYNAVLALAEAGHRPETDEHLARAVKPCWPRNGRKAVGKATLSTRASTRPSAPRSSP